MSRGRLTTGIPSAPTPPKEASENPREVLNSPRGSALELLPVVGPDHHSGLEYSS